MVSSPTQPSFFRCSGQERADGRPVCRIIWECVKGMNQAQHPGLSGIAEPDSLSLFNNDGTHPTINFLGLH